MTRETPPAVMSNYPFDVLDYLVPLMVLSGACLSLLIDPVGLSRYTLALGIGFAGGYMLSRYWIKGHQISSFQIVEELARQRLQSLSTMELGQRSLQRDESMELLLLPDKSVDQSLDRIIHEIVQRYINKWYNHYEVSKSNQFQDSIKYSLRLCFIKMGVSMGKTHAAGLILMVVQTFLRHLKEYRLFEKSGLTLKEYIAQNPKSPYNRFSQLKEKTNDFMEAAMRILVHALPKSDRSNAIVFSIVNELLGTTIIPKLVDKLADPDFINGHLVSAFVPKDGGDTNKDESKEDDAVQGLDIKRLLPKLVLADSSTDVSLESIFVQGEALIEFMDFMKSENAYSLVQFCFMVDSYRRVCEFTRQEALASSSTARLNRIASDAIEVYDTFFSESAIYPIKLEGHDDLFQQTRMNIAERPDPDVFDPLLQVVLTLLNSHYLSKFKESEIYARFLLTTAAQDRLKRKAGKADMHQVKASVWMDKPSPAETKESPNVPVRLVRSLSRSNAQVPIQIDHARLASVSTPELSKIQTMGKKEPPTASDPIMNTSNQSSGEMTRSHSQIDVYKEAIESMAERVRAVDESIASCTEEHLLPDLKTTKQVLENQMILLSEQMKEEMLSSSVSPHPLNEVARSPPKESASHVFSSDQYKSSMKKLTKVFTDAGTAIKKVTIASNREGREGESRLRYRSKSPRKKEGRSSLDESRNKDTEAYESRTKTESAPVLSNDSKISEKSYVIESRSRTLSETASTPLRKNATQERPMSMPPRSLEIITESMQAEVLEGKEATPIKKSVADIKTKTLKKAELDTILDCGFGAIEEIFHLTAPTNWIRNQGLHFVKTILRNAYGDVISDMIQTKLTEFVAPDNIAKYLNGAADSVWPEVDLPDRTAAEKDLTRAEAWQHILHSSNVTPLGAGIDRIQTIVGRYNTVIGLTRLFNMLQHPELNQLLVFNILEIIIQITMVP